MAARTLTYTPNMGPGPGIGTGVIKAPHVGTSVVAWDFNSGATKLGTLSDTVLLGKVPSGALILGKNLRFGAVAGTAGGTWSLNLLVPENAGTLSLYATLVPSMTSSATAATFTDYVPYKLSFSDDRIIQYAILALNCTTGPTETVSVSMQGYITYSTDGTSLV